MINRAIVIILALIFGYSYNTINNEDQTLYPIVENGFWGFIDQKGNIAIEPKFRSASPFSEKLAAARLNGTYGYIDTTGSFFIPPKYDIAYSFKNEIALVYLNHKPYLINKEGTTLFEHNFSEINRFRANKYALVKTRSEKLGMIDNKGNLIVDTVFSEINLSNNFFVVSSLNHKPYDENENEITYEIGILDTLGNWIIEYGKYKNIESIAGGYFLAERFDQTDEERRWTHDDVVLNKNGKEVFRLKPNDFFFNFYNTGYHCNRAVIRFLPSKKKKRKNQKDYMGIINAKGEIVKSDLNWTDLTPFSLDRAFVQEKDELWFMINREGEKINNQGYNQILFDYSSKAEELFQNGTAMVKDSLGWILIDTLGNIKNRLGGLDFNRRDLHRYRNTIYTEKDIRTKNDNYSHCFGFWDTERGKLIDPKFNVINKQELSNRLIYVVEDKRMGYINNKGNYIWRANKQKESQQIDSLNIDFMNRGYFYASSPFKEDLAGFGGWGGSDNKVNQDKNYKFSDNKLKIIVNQNDTGIYANKYFAVKLYVTNSTKDTYYFNAQDSRLYLKLQAKDKDGIWNDIEYLPSSWCGNSYHILYLSPSSYWKFDIPVYNGDFKTILRAELLYKKNKDDEDELTLYSNEFKGSVNPGQFWRKNNYYPSGLMDPYND